MIDQLQGCIAAIKEKSITLTIQGVGFGLHVPQPQQYRCGQEQIFYTYLHWHPDNGPSLYGFTTELERKVFLMIIDCPKIGPSIGLTILSQLSAPHFLELIATANQDGLSALHGIGAKKAEQLIVELKQKVQKLLKAGDIALEPQQSFVIWQQLQEVLTSLNYSKQEITKTTQYLADKYAQESLPIDHLIRAALAFLSQKQG
jgi:Holliday junction DNA helicase RuvA